LAGRRWRHAPGAAVGFGPDSGLSAPAALQHTRCDGGDVPLVWSARFGQRERSDRLDEVPHL